MWRRTDLAFCSTRMSLSCYGRGKFTLNQASISYETGNFLTVWNTLSTKEGKFGLVQTPVTQNKPADEDPACIKKKTEEKKSFPSSQGYKVLTKRTFVKFTWQALLCSTLKNICKMLCTDTPAIFHSHIVPGNNSPRHLLPMEWVTLLWLGELTLTTKYL